MASAKSAQKQATNPKGVTKDGKPRQRGYRTYYGLSVSGLMIRYPSFEARERAVLDEDVKRLTAHEVRARAARGEQAILPESARAVTPRPPKAETAQSVIRDTTESADYTLGREAGHGMRVDMRTILEAQLMLDQSATALAVTRRKLDDLLKKLGG